MTRPLPEGHTARKLADAMRAVPGIPAGMIRDAGRGYYHDYLSPLDLPETQLAADLASTADALPEPQRPAVLSLRDRVIAGEFDASRAEADAWAASPEGRAAFRALHGLGGA